MLAIYLIGRQLGGSAPILFGGPLPWWSYVIGLQNVWMAIEQTYGAAWLAGTWSLAIEEQFYLIFPLVVYYAPSRWLPRFWSRFWCCVRSGASSHTASATNSAITC